MRGRKLGTSAATPGIHNELSLLRERWRVGVFK